MTQHDARSPGDLVVIALFAALLLVPAALALTGHAGFDVAFLERTEHRRPFVAPPPTSGALATGGWERDVERQIADAFPLRRQLIEGYHVTKYVALRDARSQSVIGGRDGWFFLGDEERTYLTDRTHPNDADLAHVADVYAARAAWCARHRIRYVFVLVPNKSTVYPQYLPAGVVPVKPSPADRLLALLRARGIRYVDTRAAVIAASRDAEVYSKGDTHWNDAGAYAAYRAIVAALHDVGARETIPRGALRAHLDPADGDILGMAGLAGFVHNRWLHYDFPHRAHAVAEPATAATGSAPRLFARRTTLVDDPSLPTAVVFGDSFAEQLEPFLAESFRRATLLHHLTIARQFDEPTVSAEHPGVVIQELVERTMVIGAQFEP